MNFAPGSILFNLQCNVYLVLEDELGWVKVQCVYDFRPSEKGDIGNIRDYTKEVWDDYQEFTGTLEEFKAEYL